MKILEQTAKFLAEKLTAVSRKITVHTENHGNPHGVTKAQVGLGNADNTSDADKPLSAAQMEALGTMNGTISGHVAEASIHKTSSEIRAEITESDIPAAIPRIGDIDSRIVTHNNSPEAHADIREQITEHTGRTDNPHSVTKAQVGLGNTDNTSDADKPVSSATAAEIAAVRTETVNGLNNKVDKQDGYGLSSNDYSTAEKKKLGHLGEYVRKCTFKRNTSSTHYYLRSETWDPAVGGENEILCEIPQVNETADGFCTPGMKTVIDGLSYGSGTLNAQGTPSAQWNIGTPGGPSLKASGGQMEVRNAADTAYADLSVRDLSVKGNLAVEGESFIVNTQTVEVADNTILLNKGEVGTGVTKGIAGLEVDRGSEEKYKIIFDESDDRVKVGKGNDLWPVMLRDKDADLTAGNILIWDAAAKRAVSGKNIDTELSGYLSKSGGNMNGQINMGGSLITFGTSCGLGLEQGKEILYLGGGSDIVLNVPHNAAVTRIKGGMKYKMWDETNDGPGSGLDADTVDGRHASDFALTADLGLLLAKSGDTRDNTVTFTEAAVAENISSGEKHTVLFGKIRKWFSSLGTLAFRNTVSIPEVENLQHTLDGKEAVFAKNAAFNKNFGSTAGTVCEGNDSRLSDARPANGGNADTVDNRHADQFMYIQGNDAASLDEIPTTFAAGLIKNHVPGIEYNAILQAYDFGGNYLQLLLKGMGESERVSFRSSVNNKWRDLAFADGLIMEDKSGGILAENTVKNMHGFGYTRNGFSSNGSFISFGGVGNKYHTQLQGSYEFDNLYFRTYNSDVDQLSFHPWKKVATTEDLPKVIVSEAEPTLPSGESFKDGDIWVQP